MLKQLTTPEPAGRKAIFRRKNLQASTMRWSFMTGENGPSTFSPTAGRPAGWLNEIKMSNSSSHPHWASHGWKATKKTVLPFMRSTVFYAITDDFLFQSPVCMESSRLIHSFISMGAEIISLALKQICPAHGSTIGIKISKCRT